MSRAMKLGMTFGYWSKGFNPDVIEQAQVAEALGFDSIWTAESYVRAEGLFCIQNQVRKRRSRPSSRPAMRGC